MHYVNNVIKGMGVFTFSPEVERSVKSGEYFKYYAGTVKPPNTALCLPPSTGSNTAAHFKSQKAIRFL